MVNHDQAKVDGDNRVRDKVDLNVMAKMLGDQVVSLNMVISLNMDQTVRVLMDRLLTVQMDAKTLAIKILIDWAN